jgi:hypothetical protein
MMDREPHACVIGAGKPGTTTSQLRYGSFSPQDQPLKTTEQMVGSIADLQGDKGSWKPRFEHEWPRLQAKLEKLKNLPVDRGASWILRAV